MAYIKSTFQIERMDLERGLMETIARPPLQSRRGRARRHSRDWGPSGDRRKAGREAVMVDGRYRPLGSKDREFLSPRSGYGGWGCALKSQFPGLMLDVSCLWIC